MNCPPNKAMNRTLDRSLPALPLQSVAVKRRLLRRLNRASRRLQTLRGWSHEIVAENGDAYFYLMRTMPASAGPFQALFIRLAC